MKSFVPFLALGVVAAVQAQEQCASLVAKIPTCAVKCIDTAAASAGCSDPADLACQCKNTEKINAQALNCVLSGCGAQQGLEAQSAAAAVCECVSKAGSSSSSGEASSTEASSSEAPSTSTAATSPTAEPSATTPTGSSPPFPTVSQVADGQVQAGTGTASSGLPPSSTPVPFTGAGMKTAAPIAGVVLAFVAAIAAF